MSSKKFALLIQYDGTDYLGWQRQKKERTVQGEIEEKLSLILSERISLKGASRTDAGAHALGQVAVFKTSRDFEMGKTLKGLNACLPEDIRVIEMKEVPPEFDPIRDAVEKSYAYLIYRGEKTPPFLSRYAFNVKWDFNHDLFKEVFRIFEGEHDFSYYRGGGSEVKSTVRKIFKIDILEKDQFIIIQMRGNGFLKQMVRNMVGTALMVASGKLNFENVKEWKPLHPSKGFRYTVPSRGLFLLEVKFRGNYPQFTKRGDEILNFCFPDYGSGENVEGDI